MALFTFENKKRGLLQQLLSFIISNIMAFVWSWHEGLFYVLSLSSYIHCPLSLAFKNQSPPPPFKIGHNLWSSLLDFHTNYLLITQWQFSLIVVVKIIRALILEKVCI